MGRHDFYSGLVKPVLNVLMHLRINDGHFPRLVRVSVQLVTHVRVIEAGLQDKGSRLL